MANIVLITGANRGIGLEFVRYYRSKSFEVIALCRNASKELLESGAEVIEGIDVSREQDCAELKQSLVGKHIDLVINNAGILRDEQLDYLNFDSIQDQFAVNALGPLRVTQAVLPSLKPGSKIALITSRMGSIADNGSGGRYGYRMSKAALNAAGMSLALDLKPRGIAVAILHPGYVATEMVGGRGDISPDVAAKRLAARIDSLNLDNTGTFWHSNGEVLPW
jgi:NAD(P)-dependent dehydrogenase (short-subunit alcohol dehydrogenase family)